MKLKLLLCLTFLLTISVACESIDDQELSKLNLDKKGDYLLFFSNEDYIELEESYYDALIELKKEFPKRITDVYIIQASKKHEKIKMYNVTTYPTLIVVKDGKVITKLEGKNSKKDIIKNIQNSY